ncbi:hypothetical protein L3Q82_005247 [Scortum barcoo]|uniref:Uncharacterized protein n=1 Tax=Scortum barcoo TaxID=214431 RepID=A0ACB8VCL1_9TELE|nr:hypothetical protein L3Q82_005247 [Scortum barcoo]
MLGGSISKKDTSRLDKLIRRAGSVVGTKLDSLVTGGGRVEDSGQTPGYYGQCQPPSAHRKCKKNIENAKDTKRQQSPNQEEVRDSWTKHLAAYTLNNSHNKLYKGDKASQNRQLQLAFCLRKEEKRRARERRGSRERREECKEGTEQTVLPEETQILQRVQQAPADLLSVYSALFFVAVRLGWWPQGLEQFVIKNQVYKQDEGHHDCPLLSPLTAAGLRDESIVWEEENKEEEEGGRED